MWASVQELVSSLTGLDRESENFATACEWSAGNLKRHTYLDLDQTKVVRSYAAVVEKLRVHARHAEARRLETLFDRTKALGKVRSVSVANVLASSLLPPWTPAHTHPRWVVVVLTSAGLCLCPALLRRLCVKPSCVLLS